ncbi:8379_t:CDS:2, partial [Racocetra fulgida]
EEEAESVFNYRFAQPLSVLSNAKVQRNRPIKGIQIHLHVYQESTNYKDKYVVVIEYGNRTKIKDIDAVIYATKYQIEFLFLDRDIDLDT